MSAATSISYPTISIASPLEKPDLARARIERLMGLEVPRLEMFARSTAGGWDGWGHQVDKFG